MRNVMDTSATYYKRVAEEIRKTLEAQGKTQKYLTKECASKFGIEISPSTISKIVNSDGGHMSMVFVSAICQILGIDLSSVLSIQGGDYGGSGEGEVFAPPGSAIEPGVRENLIRDPRDNAFFGYVDRTYDIYFWPTTSDNNQLVHGTMELSNEGDKFCKVHICLDTGKPVKEYFGQMVISLQQQACYCTVESRRLSERCSFVFYHRFFSEGALRARLAAVTTVSVGDARRPTMHRMAICEQGAVDSSEKLAFIASHLLLNSSQIIVPEEKMERLRQDEDLRDLLKALERDGRRYYIFDESEIRLLPSQDFPSMANAITRLRASSTAQHYNKIGGKVDDFLYKYLFMYTVPEDLEEE